MIKFSLNYEAIEAKKDKTNLMNGKSLNNIMDVIFRVLWLVHKECTKTFICITNEMAKKEKIVSNDLLETDYFVIVNVSYIIYIVDPF